MGSDIIHTAFLHRRICLVDEVVLEASVGPMPDVPINRLLNLKVASDRSGLAPNKPLPVRTISDLVEAGLPAAMRLTTRRQKARRWVVATYAPQEAAHIHAHARKGPDGAINGLALPLIFTVKSPRIGMMPPSQDRGRGCLRLPWLAGRFSRNPANRANLSDVLPPCL